AAFGHQAFAPAEKADVRPRRWGSVPLAFREAAEGDEPDQGDDQAPPEAPDDDQDDPKDHEDSAEANPSDSCVCHLCCPFRFWLIGHAGLPSPQPLTPVVFPGLQGVAVGRFVYTPTGTA